MSSEHQIAAKLADFFAELARHEDAVDTIRSIVTEKCPNSDEAVSLIYADPSSPIDRNIILQFIAKESPTAAATAARSIGDFFSMYSRNCSNKEMNFEDFKKFVCHGDPNKLLTCDRLHSERYELRYTLFLMLTKEIENCRNQRKALEELFIHCQTVLPLLFPRTEEHLEPKSIITLCRSCGIDLSASARTLLWRRLLKLCHLDTTRQCLTIKQFNNLMRGTGGFGNAGSFHSKPANTSAQYTPVRQLKQSDLRSSDRSTALKSNEKRDLKIQLEHVSREVKKKLVFDSLAEVMLKKVLAFLVAVCRRDKQINAVKADLFSRYKVNVAKLFEFIDTTRSEFVTSRQLECFFGDISTLVVYFYGSEGVVRFCDFVKILVPLSANFEDVESRLEDEVTPEIFEKIERIFKKMAEAELSNLKDIGRLAQEFKLSNKTDLLRQSLFLHVNRLNTTELSDIFDKNSTLISEMELTLLFRKYDRDFDGYLTLEDFSPYLL